MYYRQTGLLLTGDTMYAGRIYINMPDHAVFTASADRLVDFARTRVITHVLGTHIEQRGPYRDYPVGTTFAPDEQRLELSYGHLLELQQGVHDLDAAGKVVQRAFRDFSIAGPTRSATRSCPTGRLVRHSDRHRARNLGSAATWGVVARRTPTGTQG